MKRSVVIALVVVLALGALVWSASRTARVTCEACIEFGGRTECAKAAGSDRERAMMEVATVVCARLAGGMTDSLRCERTPPLKETCTGGAAAGKGRY